MRGVRTIWHHPHFRESYAELPRRVKAKAESREKLLLKGRLADLYSFSVDATRRIRFRFREDGVIFLDIGDHDLYR